MSSCQLLQLLQQDCSELAGAFDEVLGFDDLNIRRDRTMSVRLPPHVELILELTANTWSSMSSTRPPAITPQTWTFLPKATTSGTTSSCWKAHAVPVIPAPVCTSSMTNSASNSWQSARSFCRKRGRKW